jgi:hypothetical protein
MCTKRNSTRTNSRESGRDIFLYLSVNISVFECSVCFFVCLCTPSVLNTESISTGLSVMDSSFAQECHKIYSITLSYQRAGQYVQKVAGTKSNIRKL